MQADDRVWWGRTGRTFPFASVFVGLGQLVPTTFWSTRTLATTERRNKKARAIFGRDKIFSTPKPERLLNRIIHIATNPGDLVLDSFAGSGTTGAVAHKMGRRWIMVEMGEHCHTHIIPRLKKVIDGQDPGGITEAVGWKGGGGFRYYRLAPSLLDKDDWGNLGHQQGVQRRRCSPKPSASSKGSPTRRVTPIYWQQGCSTERDFIYVTTANLAAAQLHQLSDDVGTSRTLLVLCTAFRGDTAEFSNLTVRKIPTHVLDRCEWGRDDYSLAVANLPPAPPPPGQQDLFVEERA